MIKGFIYTIRSYQTDKYYIGSTTQKLCKRLQDHRRSYKSNKVYTTSFDILKYNDHYIELLENYECKDKNELRRREGELQREHKDNIVNCRIECRSREQWYIDNSERVCKRDNEYKIKNKVHLSKKAKEYRIKNKDKIAKKDKEYRIKNRYLLREKAKQYRIANKEKLFKKCDCICGGRYIYKNKSDHVKTKKHQKYITDNKI